MAGASVGRPPLQANPMINVADILKARILVVDDDRDAADTIVLTQPLDEDAG